MTKIIQCALYKHLHLIHIAKYYRWDYYCSDDLDTERFKNLAGQGVFARKKSRYLLLIHIRAQNNI